VTTSVERYEGACHCHALGYAFHTRVPVTQWRVRACQCKFCRTHGAMTTSDPAGQMAFLIREPALISRYQFGLRTAEFMICGRCGAYVGARMEAGPQAYGIINVRALSPMPVGLPDPMPMSYDGEDVGARGRRREARWTPCR
jgi:hypothetical protein